MNNVNVRFLQDIKRALGCSICTSYHHKMHTVDTNRCEQNIFKTLFQKDCFLSYCVISCFATLCSKGISGISQVQNQPSQLYQESHYTNVGIGIRGHRKAGYTFEDIRQEHQQTFFLLWKKCISQSIGQQSPTAVIPNQRFLSCWLGSGSQEVRDRVQVSPQSWPCLLLVPLKSEVLAGAQVQPL